MKTLLITLIALFNCLSIFSQQFTTVFKSGTEGYKSFRIPAIIQIAKGELIAFCEGRVDGMGDFGNIDLVMKRSSDGGHTWSKLQVVTEMGTSQLSNPAPVFDTTDPNYPQGRIFLFFNTGDCHEGDILRGKGLKKNYYQTSEDRGRTWSEPVDITTQTHFPKRPDLNPQYSSPKDWRYYASTPGHAIQLKNGKYKGRIYIAANHSAGEPKPRAEHYVAHGYYTDDHGKTFHVSEDVPILGSNESMAVELSGGRLMMNSRNQKGDVRARIVSISSNGGETWDTSGFDCRLIDPVCQGCITNIGEHKGKTILAFCNAASTKGRNHLTLKISFDEGLTWGKSIPIYGNNDNKKDYSAYSDIVKMNNKEVGVLFEKDNYSEIVFTTIRWK